ncbi:MAG TPA: TonB-dependent receptor [Steroidobacteraceae bacterium]|jgi:iron complex outermembrane receptor protein|nr:TonB-dependent receptor [Steroidobacteraceae bacterium]
MRRAHRRITTSGLIPFGVTALLALACTPHAAPAQQAPPAQAAEEAPAPAGLQEVVVTATRREQSLSKVPISVTALTQESLDDRGIKDFSEVARFTPGVNFDNSGTNNISIRGISGTGGAGTTGIYIDDTPIQMRALAFSPDEALPKSFDVDRVEVLRGPQGTLFGSGSEGGTVRYITTQPSLTKTSVYARAEVSTTEGGDPSYEAGVAAGGPLIDGVLGARVTVWYRRDGGWIDDIDPYTLALVEHNANHEESELVRLALLWAPDSRWRITPSLYYQDRQRHDISNYWPLYSNPGSDRFVDADPTLHNNPDQFYLPALKIDGDLGKVELISNTSFYHRENQTGYDGTLYNLGYYQTQNAAPIFLDNPAAGSTWLVPFPLLDANGLHVPGLDYRAPATIDNGQENLTQEIRLQSSDADAKLIWTAGLFANENRQTYFEQIHDPMLGQLTNVVFGDPNFTDYFCYLNAAGQCTGPDGYVPGYGTDSYFLHTASKDEQIAAFGELTYGFTERLKLTVGARESHMKYSFDTYTGGPQLYAPPRAGTGDISENAFTPKVSLQFQEDPSDMYYATYAKGFRPGGANNPIPNAACPTDFANFGIQTDPGTFSSDSVNSYEVGAKNNFNNRVRLATSIYYIQWNNIQQLIVPPVCQISFIANTGNAVAKGADLQADVSFTDNFTMELATGYTEARYTSNFSFAPPCGPGGQPAGGALCALNANPLVANGDAIIGASSETGGGAPTSPFTASLGFEYHFTIATHESFLRADAEYQGRAKWLTANEDVGSSQYDPANFVLPATTFASIRGGMQFGGWSVQGFVDNLFNTHDLTDYNYTICSNPGAPPGIACVPTTPGASRLERAYTFRPRTIGVTMILRQ